MHAKTHLMSLAGEATDHRLGAMLVSAGKLTMTQVDRVLQVQCEERQRFGELTVKLGYASNADVSQMLARQFEYPYVIPGESGIHGDVVAAYEPFSNAVEGLRALRTQLKFRWLDKTEHRTLAVISPRHRDGRSYLAANLAVVFAQLGERTLLIDADMRRPRQHQLFQLPDGHGLSTILAGRDDVSIVQPLPQMRALSVMPAGPTPPNPVELLDRPVFSRVLDTLKEQYDVIIIDTPAAVAHAADAHAVAARAHAALMVVRRNVTRMNEVKSLAGAVQTTEIVGTVVNEF